MTSALSWEDEVFLQRLSNLLIDEGIELIGPDGSSLERPERFFFKILDIVKLREQNK